MRWALVMLLLLLVTSGVRAAGYTPEALTDEQLTAAMVKATDFLVARQRTDHWEAAEGGKYSASYTTALALQSLFEAGNSFIHSSLYAQRAKLHWRSSELKSVLPWMSKHSPADAITAAAYGRSLRHVYPSPRPSFPEVYGVVDACAGQLVNAMTAGEELAAGTDPAMTLASDILSRRHEFPQSYWEATDVFWRRTQKADGTWEKGPAALAALILATQHPSSNALDEERDRNIESGITALHAHYDPSTSDPQSLLAIEDAALAAGLKSIQRRHWFRQGAAALLNAQRADGSFAERDAVVQTSRGLLFLAQGRQPVLLNKLQYPGRWNARRSDYLYATDWMARRLCGFPLMSQTVDVKQDEDWTDSPLLLITGSEDPHFADAELQKLEAFAWGGGLIFSIADGNSAAFTEAMKRAMEKIGRGRCAVRQLPGDHPLFSRNMGIDMPRPPALLGVSNGVRELWIHSPEDVGAAWQQRKYSQRNAFELGIALYFYSRGMMAPANNLQTLAVLPPAAPAVRTIDVARIAYHGNADPEPSAWPRMAKLAERDFKTELRLHSVKMRDLDPGRMPLAHLTGVGKVTFTDDEIQQMTRYLREGGTLFVDAAGGDEAFAAAARSFIEKVYPRKALEPLPEDHAIYSGAIAGGVKLEEVAFRKFAMIKAQRRVTKPQLQAVTVEGRARIIFSAHDIISGFLGTQTWGIVGYAPESSQRLAQNILLYAASKP